MANKAFKFRIYPSTEQQLLINKTFGCARFVYNHWLHRKIDLYNEDKSRFSYVQCANEMAHMKKTDYQFLKEVDSVALQQALRHLDTAFQNFFQRPSMGFPKFKSKKSAKKSYSTIKIQNNISIENGRLKLPKIGLVKVKQHREIPRNYNLKSVTVSKSCSGKYYASILFEYDNQVKRVEPMSFLGLDFSMHELYVDSNGQEPNYPRYYRAAEKKLAHEQRKLSKMQKGSKNRQKQKIKVAKLHEHISNQRKDFLHKQSRQITNVYDCVCIEDLNMQGMARSLRFGKSVSDNGWGMFTRMMEYKLAEQGKQLVRIDKYFPSSQMCHVCGVLNHATKDLSVREWTCPDCGTHHNRDHNAAINIREEGKRMICA